MAGVYCTGCRTWLAVPKDQTKTEVRKRHEPWCRLPADVFAGHPDLLELNAQLEGFYGGYDG
jgi:hypothetical protein